MYMMISCSPKFAIICVREMISLTHLSVAYISTSAELYTVIFGVLIANVEVHGMQVCVWTLIIFAKVE